MIQISKATKKEIKKYNEEEWHKVDIEHYGKRVDWKENDFIFKAVESGDIVGTIIGKHESGVVYIDELIVSQDKRGKGIGKALLEQAVNFGKKIGAHKIHLITGKSWEANKFYEALGFQKVADLPNHHFKIDFVIYEKAI